MCKLIVSIVANMKTQYRVPVLVVPGTVLYCFQQMMTSFFWCGLTDRLSTESLHTHRATTEDTSLYVPATAPVSHAVWIRIRTNTVSENGVSCSTPGYAPN